MAQFASIQYLKDTLPEDAWYWVITALREDTLTWKSLQDPNLLTAAIKKLGPNPRRWSPMNISLVALGVDLKSDEVRDTRLEKLSPKLYQRVYQAYEQFTPNATLPIDLKVAGLLALYYKENEIEIDPKIPRTSLACLFSILPEPDSAFSQLNPELVIHAILSNPYKPDEQINILWKFTKQAENNRKMEILHELSKKRPNIAAKLAKELLNDWPSSMAKINFEVNDDNQINQLARIIENTDILSLANQHDAFSRHVNQAIEMTEEIQTKLVYKLIEKDISDGDLDNANNRWNQVKFRTTPVQNANIFLNLVNHNYKNEAIEWIKNHLTGNQINDPEYLLAKGYLEFFEKNQGKAKALIQRSLVGYKQRTNNKLEFLHSLTTLALKLKLNQEALEAIHLALELEPNNFTSIDLLRKSYLANNQYTEAINTAHLAVALQSDFLQTHRNLAETFEIAKEWSHALQIRSSILSHHESFSKDDAYQDAYQFAICALKGNQPKNTEEVCRKLLDMKPDDPEVHHLLGQTYQIMGDLKKSQEYFSKATRLAPDKAKSWLALADIYQERGQKSRQKETLQTAANIVTNDPEIFFVLGQIHLEEGSPTQALQDFRTAYSLSKSNSDNTSENIKSQIALLLGNTLDRLGHHLEARTILEEAYEEDKDQMELAHAYARSLLNTKSPLDALSVLEETRKKTLNSIEINLDYAKACLATKSNLDEAEETLVEILDIHPDFAEAKALLAEVYESNKELDLSLQIYKEALDTHLRENPDWLTRLSLGISEVYLKKKQPENAIAVLNSALLNTNNEQEILKFLSKAYHAANLREKAIWAAKSVLDLNPLDESSLDWFIEHAIDMGSTNKAIEVLEEKTKNRPVTASHLIKLGWLYTHEGDYENANKTFSKIRQAEQVSSTELLKASEGLVAINEISSAIDLIEKGIQLSNSSGDTDIIPELLLAKIDAYQKDSTFDLALETLEEAIKLSPQNPVLIIKRAGLLLDLSAVDDAIKCIEDGLISFPNNKELHLQAIKLYRTNGQLIEASIHAQEVIHILHLNEVEKIDANTITTIIDLADCMLQTNLINQLIEMFERMDTPLDSGLEHYHCLCGEIALDSNEEIRAVDSLNTALKINPDHPRTLALQSRLKSRQDDFDSAGLLFQNALKSLGNYPDKKRIYYRKSSEYTVDFIDFPISTYIALAKAGIEFNEWQAVSLLFKRALDQSIEEPRSQYHYARALVMKAEYQRLCETINVINHAPGDSATANYAYKEFETAILKAAHTIAKYSENTPDPELNYDQTKESIAKWLARGQAVFQPSIEHAKAIQKLSIDPENLAAYIATLREIGELDEAEKAAHSILSDVDSDKDNPYLLAQIALTLAEKSYDNAIDASYQAIELSRWQKYTDQPIFFAVAAEVAGKHKNIQLQKEFLCNALLIWEDEPIWLSKIADLHQQSGQKEEIEESIQYLEKAILLEPKNLEHYLKLGEVHQRLDNPKGKIIVLDQATRAFPQKPEPWIALAKAHHENSEIPQAIRCANTVLQINPQFHEASLLLAETSLEVNNPKKAAQYIEKILQDDPSNQDALIMSSNVYSILNKPERALESIEKVLPSLAGSIPLQLKRAQLIEETKGSKDALEMLLDLNEMNPHTPQLLAAIAEIYSNLNQPGKAIEKAQEALSAADEKLSRKEHLSTLTLLGRLLRKTGNLDQSVFYLNEAIEKDPNNSAAFVELGRCYQEQRLFDRALQHFQNAIELSPEDSQPYYYAGLTFKETKDFVNAERMFKFAAKLAPRNMNIYRQLAAVTAINFVQNHQSRNEVENPISMAVSIERNEK